MIKTGTLNVWEENDDYCTSSELYLGQSSSLDTWIDFGDVHIGVAMTGFNVRENQEVVVITPKST